MSLAHVDPPRPPIPCRNPRHTHRYVTQARCFPLTDPQRSTIHQAVGLAALTTVAAACTVVVAVYAAGEAVATYGPLAGQLAKARAQEAWCRWLG